MPTRRTPYHLADVIVRALRFFYLLWGGMLLGTLAVYNRVRLPDFVWRWPWGARALTTPWARGVLLGVAIAMSLAALAEVWELVDRILVRFIHESERER